jgi:CRP/FNR family transcriptional regulator, cyclic AMP receptor protein
MVVHVLFEPIDYGEAALGANGPLALAEVALFSGLGEAELRVVAQLGAERSFAKGAIIINEGVHAQALYVLLKGRVKIFLTSADGREIVLRTQGPHEFFGELSLLDDAAASASVMALEPCRCIVLSVESFNRCCRDYPLIGLQLLQQLAQRVRQLTDQVKSLAVLDVYQRIVRTLHALAELQGGELVIRERLTHQDIANRVSASREMVSRILKDLTDGGYLSLEKTRIVIRRKLPPSW